MSGPQTRNQDGAAPYRDPGARLSLRGPDRRRGFSWASQLRVLVPLLIVWLGGFGVLGAVVAHGEVGSLFLDPAYLNGGVWYDGLVSQLGVVAWTVAVASAGWSAWIAKVSGRASAARFLFCASIVGAVLLVDDLFGFHSLAPTFGIPKIVGELMVLTPLGAWLVRFWPDISRTRYPVLLASLGANGISVIVDGLFHPSNADLGLVFEDGPKFLGILAWATYFVLTTYDIARSAMASRMTDTASRMTDSASRMTDIALPAESGPFGHRATETIRMATQEPGGVGTNGAGDPVPQC